MLSGIFENVVAGGILLLLPPLVLFIVKTYRDSRPIKGFVTFNPDTYGDYGKIDPKESHLLLGVTLISKYKDLLVDRAELLVNGEVRSTWEKSNFLSKKSYKKLQQNQPEMISISLSNAAANLKSNKVSLIRSVKVRVYLRDRKRSSKIKISPDAKLEIRDELSSALK